MTKLTKVDIVKILLAEEGFEQEYCSPNLVADFAFNRGFKLSSDEVVAISNEYTGDESTPNRS